MFGRGRSTSAGVSIYLEHMRQGTCLDDLSELKATLLGRLSNVRKFEVISRE